MRLQFLLRYLSIFLASALLSVSIAQGADRGIIIDRMKIIDNTPRGRALIRLRTRAAEGIQKGPDGDPANLDGTLEIFYNDGSTSGAPYDALTLVQE